jgi:DNA excision repair protein ERCC-2
MIALAANSMINRSHGASRVKERHQIAVRTLVDYVLRSGDLDMRFAAPGRPLEGIRAHQRLQRQRPDGYRAEVPVSIELVASDLILVVSGRIDGVLETQDAIIVEEIKSTTQDLDMIKSDPDPCHWGQAKVYAYLLAHERNLDAIAVHLTYVHLDTGDVLELVERLCREELETFFQDLVERYLKWATTLTRWRHLRDQTVLAMKFPFADYRSGQRTMAVAVYRALRDGHQALIQASTGIGKTMAVLFPALKTIGEGLTDRVFFLTARNTGKTSAIKALNLLQQKGLRLKRVSLTAKDRICFCPEATCNPDACAYANGHFDRLAAAMAEAFEHDNLDRETIEVSAQNHRVCPFEFSLELSRWADCIICDYNYAFDPRVYLKRFFDEENGAYAFLIDEAHNLVDRSREMFSAEIRKADFLELRRAVKALLPAVYRAAGKINTWMRTAAKQTLEAGGFQSDGQRPDGIEPLLRGFIRVAERWLAKNQPAPYREIVLERYFEITCFLRVLDQVDDSYVTCRQVTGRDFKLKLFCLDPSGQLRSALRRCRATVFFSATMTPAHYFQNILGCDSAAAKLTVPSPFPREHLKVFIAGGVSTTYAQRAPSVDQIVELIQSFSMAKKGNYLCFFPSYEYMSMVVECMAPSKQHLSILVQEREMDDMGRSLFLDRFSAHSQETLVGFAVMGGIFGEGIDLVGERLSGAVIVSVGLPAVCPERDLIRGYFDQWGTGFDFAYRFPGINRVLQAAGRVIRSDQDRGAILLVDRRFCHREYQRLLPSHWTPERVSSPQQLETHLNTFWSSGD